MNLTRFKKFSLLFLALASILACGPFAAATPQPAATLNALYTAAAQTLEGMSTQAANTLIAQSSPTGTLSIPIASSTPFSTFTNVPPLATVSRCDSASFVADVTYPDGSIVGRSAPFTKTWRIKNTGTCTWTTSYDIVYVSGEKFSAKDAVPLPETVSPGETVEISIDLIAPNSNGNYRGNWKLRNESGVVFGLGSSSNSNFYVDVNVSGYSITGYDFAANYCEASWENNTRDLPCPGTDGENRGFVMLLNAPKLEDGNVKDKGLLTFPRRAGDGLISGKYPGINIKSGDHFQALISCQYKANDCDVYFHLEYQIGNGEIRTLGQWYEAYEGQYYPINIDLSSLDGSRVKFILTVFANGSAHEDYALWIAPRITRQSSQAPTATATFTTTPSPTATATATATQTPTNTPTATP